MDSESSPLRPSSPETTSEHGTPVESPMSTPPPPCSPSSPALYGVSGSPQKPEDEDSTRSVLEKLKKGVCHWKNEEADRLEEFAKAGEVTP